MKVELLYNTPLYVCAMAIRQCWDSRDKSDTVIYDVECTSRIQGSWFERSAICGEKDRALIERIGNQNKHKSVLEHLVYTFDIDGISRAVLQELARHRIASYSVKSTRYTLKELRDVDLWLEDEITTVNYEEVAKFCVLTEDSFVNKAIAYNLMELQDCLLAGISNDKAKYCLPEAYKTSLTMTINARALQNFLELRTSKHALWEIQDLARAMFEAIPDDHKYLFEDYLYGSMDGSI